MNADLLEKLISETGSAEASVKSKFPDIVWGELDDEFSEVLTFYTLPDGLQVEFSVKGKLLSALCMELVERTHQPVLYTGELPYGIQRTDGQYAVRKRLGEPLERGLPGDSWPLGRHGGYDTFRIKAHPELRLTVGYTESMQLSSMSISDPRLV